MFACAPTGSGKTLAFIVPILAHLKVLTLSMIVASMTEGLCIHAWIYPQTETRLAHTCTVTHTHITVSVTSFTLYDVCRVHRGQDSEL